MKGDGVALTHYVGHLRQGKVESRIYKSEASLTVWEPGRHPQLAACLNLPRILGNKKSIGWASLRKVGEEARKKRSQSRVSFCFACYIQNIYVGSG